MTALPYLLLAAGIGVAMCVLCCFPRVASIVITLGIVVLAAWAATDGAYLVATILAVEASGVGWLAFDCLRPGGVFAERRSLQTTPLNSDSRGVAS